MNVNGNGAPNHTAPDGKLTTVAGAPVVDNNNVITAGPRGPMLLQDVWFLEKLAHFDREVIPERRMHAKGSGAYGTFTVTNDITRYTRAKLFAEVGKKTDMFVRFSTVAGERGAAEATRDIRGFAVKFYTEEGNWDLVGNNTPTFFIRDPLKFTDLNHVVKRDPRTNLNSPRNNWDWWSLLPESLHQVTITMSDRGIPKSFRHMHGFGSHTYSFINADGVRHWVKFHHVCQQEIGFLTDAEAEAVIGKDRESNQRDLYESIERGEFPRWKLCVQIMPEADAATVPYHPFDLTKVWPHADYPLIEVGEWELNRNPDNYFAEVEQAAFSPARIVPGIGFSPDKMLQGRLFSYNDAQNYRLGVNHHQIPVNAARCPVHAYHRDGAMRVDGNYGSTLQLRAQQLWRMACAAGLSSAAGTHRRRVGLQLELPRGRRRLLHPAGKPVPVDDAMTHSSGCSPTPPRAMRGVPAEIQQRWIGHCAKADPAYGAGVAQAIEDIADKAIPAGGGNRPGSRGAALAPSAGGPSAYP